MTVINTTCTKILSSSYKLDRKENRFIESIKDLSKLTQKQADWLLAIAKKSWVSVADLEVKKTRVSKKPTVKACNHEDLGSLGYRHDEIVKCPHCGAKARVW